MMRALPEIGWAEFAPDLSDYTLSATDGTKNVWPIADSYAPLPAWGQLASAALSTTGPKGGFTARKADSTSSIFGGTATTLERFNASTLDFDDVTRTSGGDYAGSGDWDFTQFGALVIAVNGTDATQSFNVDSASNFAALSNAPIGSYVESVGGHVFIGKLSTNSRAVQWSGYEDATFWTAGQRGSDIQPLPNGGEIKGLIGFEKGLVVFQEDKIRFAEYTGGQWIFNFNVIHENIGCYAPWSVVGVRNTFFWYDVGGFYQGLDAQPIGSNKINKFIEDNVTSSNRKAMRGTVDPVRKIVSWTMLLADNTYFRIGYNWITGKWAPVYDDIAFPFFAIPTGVTFDTWDDYSSTFDALPYTFNSDVWVGDEIPLMAGFDADGNFGYFNGPNLEATLETADVNLTPGYFTNVGFVRPVDDVTPTDGHLQVGTRQYPGGAITWSDDIEADTNMARFRVNKRGFTHRIRRVIDAGATWNNSRGIIPYARTAGRR